MKGVFHVYKSFWYANCGAFRVVKKFFGFLNGDYLCQYLVDAWREDIEGDESGQRAELSFKIIIGQWKLFEL